MNSVELSIVALIWSNNEVLTYEEMASLLDISASQAFRAAKAAQSVGLLNAEIQARPVALHEVLIHVVKYVFPAKKGVEMRGQITGAHVFENQANLSGPPWVWPKATGEQRGESIEPIHRSVVAYASRNQRFHQLFAAADLIRCGNARERAAGIKILDQLLLKGQYITNRYSSANNEDQ